MTEASLKSAATSDPLVLRAHARPDANGLYVNPNPTELLQAATTELEASIASLLTEEDIARAVLEREYSLTVSSGGTDVQQGTWFELPDTVGQIQAVTIGDQRDEVTLYTSRHEFNRWWNSRYAEQSTNDDAEVVIQWDPTSQNKATLLFSPGVGTDSTAYLLHRRPVTSFNLSLFDEQDHHVILIDVKNRLSGGAFQVGRDEAVRQLKRRIAPIIHRPTAMRRDKRVERLAWKLRGYYGGASQESQRCYRSNP